MKILFATQSSSLGLFFEVYQHMQTHGGPLGPVGSAGFYISGSDFYRKYERRPELEKLPLLKEWEILEQAAHRVPNLERLRQYELAYCEPSLWPVLNADRRIFFGRDVTFTQDYAPRFKHERMLAILETAIEAVEGFFDRVQPDMVASFICVTLGDYLTYLVARRRGIPVVNMRPTRLRNYFFGGETIFEPSEDLRREYERLRAEGLSDEQRADLEAFLAEVRSSHAMYEGVLPPSALPLQGTARSLWKLGASAARFLGTVPGLIDEWYLYRFGRYRFDNSHVPRLRVSFHGLIRVPYRRWLERRRLGKHYAESRRLEPGSFVFFPLHKEPEQTMQVYSRPFQNQVEVVRNIAVSLPAGMKVVVKEHPVSVGYRPLSYYRKLLDIPNVMLAAPETSSNLLVSKAALVAVISGSGALEAALVGKPAVHFGRVPFSMLPDTMMARVADLFELPGLLSRMITEHEHDEAAVLAYLGAVDNLSVRLDWYTRLLGRAGGFRREQKAESAEEADAKRKQQIGDLADYLVARAFPNIHRERRTERLRIGARS